jgi:hypothetical protein
MKFCDISNTEVLLTAQYEQFFQDIRTKQLGPERDQAFENQRLAAQLAWDELRRRGIDHGVLRQAIDFIGGGRPNDKMNREETIKYAIDLITIR